MGKFSDAFDKIAEGLEAAAVAVREAGAAAGTASAKSEDSTGDGVASGKSGSKGKTAPAAEPVAKPASKAGKAKAPTITFEILKAKLTDLVNAKGKESVKQLLSELGAARLGDLDEEQYTEAHTKAVELLNADEEEPATEGDNDDLFGD